MTSKRAARLAILLASTVMTFSDPASAQVVWTVGIGRTSCGDALQKIKKFGASYETHYLTWIGGFISGYNLAIAEKGSVNVRVGEGISNDQIAASFKEKCKQTPQKPLPQVADEIRNELAAFRK